MSFPRLIFLTFSMLLFTAGFFATGQTSRAKLEQEKKRNLNRIAQTKKILAQTQTQKTSSLRELKTLSRRIEDQEQQIDLIEREIQLLEKELRGIARETYALDQRLKSLRTEYGQMLYTASKQSTQLNQLLFLFSAPSFQEVLVRYELLQQYTENRKDQLTQIRRVSKELNTRRLELTAKQKAQKNILGTKKEQNNVLLALKTEKDSMVVELSKQEVELRKEIRESNQAVKNLDRLISSLVAKDLAKKEEIKKNTSPPPPPPTKSEVAKSKKAPTLERKSTRAMTGNFADARRRLPWPVASGFISDHFGVKNHPVLRGVQIDNNGIDIQTVAGASVMSIFEGKVLDISEIPGLGQVVAVQHGEFYTVYANLDIVKAKVGQSVAAGDVLGTAGQRDGVTEINFQIWRQFERLNPEAWLARK